MAIYVDLSEPWVARAKGVEVYSSDYEAGVGQVEYFTEPIVLPLDQAAGESTKVDTTMIGKFRDHEEGEGVGVSYTIKVESYDYVYEAPGGDLPGCVKIVVTLYGDFTGGNEIPVEVIAHPTQRIVFWESTPALLVLRLRSLEEVRTGGRGRVRVRDRGRGRDRDRGRARGWARGWDRGQGHGRGDFGFGA